MFLDMSPLKHNHNYRLLYIGQLLSLMGTRITMVALPYQIYVLTQSTLMVGLLSLFQLVPLIFTALLGGAIADHYDRRKLLLAAEIMLSLCCLLLVWNAHRTTPYISVLFLFAALTSAINGLHRPALDGMTQAIVGTKDYKAVSVLRTFQMNLGGIAMPALSGFIIAFWGFQIAYLLDFMSFLFSWTTLYFIRFTSIRKKTSLEIIAKIREGLTYAIRRQELMGSYSIDLLAMIFAMPMALFPAVAQQFGGATTVGFLYSAVAVGGLLVSVFSAWTKYVHRYGKAITWAATSWGIFMIGFGFSTSLISALIFLALAGAADQVSSIFRLTLWNETIPNALRSRLASVEMLSYLTGPMLGNAEAGIVAAAFGVTASIVSGGILCVVGVGICAYFMPKFWRFHSSISSNKMN